MERVTLYYIKTVNIPFKNVDKDGNDSGNFAKFMNNNDEEFLLDITKCVGKVPKNNFGTYEVTVLGKFSEGITFVEWKAVEVEQSTL